MIYTNNNKMKHEKKQTCGILGGTFNPIHRGHIELAKAALEQFNLSKVYIMPNNRPAYKSNENIVSNYDRAEMVRLATDGVPGLEFSDFELNRQGITYTCDTLKLLSEKYPDIQWYFILGGDSIMYFDKWKNPRQILDYATIIAAIRDDIDKETVINKIACLELMYPGCNILFADMKSVPVSSSDIRNKIHYNIDVSEYIDESVMKYIKEHRLYMD